MGVNKIVYGGNTLVDLTDASVTPETLVEGATAYDKTGTLITGTAIVPNLFFVTNSGEQIAVGKLSIS